MRLTTSKIINDVAKVQIKSEKITPFGGIFHVRELFSRFVAPIIDKVLGIRCTSFGYQYSEIVGSLASVYFCGGDCVEGKAYRLVIQRERRLDGEQDLWEGEYTYRCILTNDYTSTNREIVGHHDLNPQKACPCIESVTKEYADLQPK